MDTPTQAYIVVGLLQLQCTSPWMSGRLNLRMHSPTTKKSMGRRKASVFIYNVCACMDTYTNVASHNGKCTSPGMSGRLNLSNDNPIPTKNMNP